MTEATKRKPRARDPKTQKQATWQVGHFTASIEGEYYTLRAGQALMVRTKSEEEFRGICETINGVQY